MGKSKRTANQRAFLIGLIGGFLMLIAGITGLSTWAAMGNAAITLTGIEALKYVFLILMILGSLGGLLVIFGSWLFVSKAKMKRKNKVSSGKTLISIGAGFGLIGLIILIVVGLLEDQLVQLMTGVNLGLIGLILSIIARKIARK